MSQASLSTSMPSKEEYRALLNSVRSSNPENLMARHFSEDYVAALDTTSQSRLWKIVKSGFENPDSRMGAYAQSSHDYEDFQALLEPMIRDHHGIATGQEIVQHHDWSAVHAKCNLEDIDPALSNISMRVRVARNLASLPMPGAMSKTQRVDFENQMIKIFSLLIQDPEFGGIYLSLTPGSRHVINAGEYQARVDEHQMFRDLRLDHYLVSAGISSDWPYGRGMYVSGSSDFIVWVGEEDHLRIMCMHRGADLSGLFSRLHAGLMKLTKVLPAFSHSASYGYLTSCPSNLGTAMRASLHLPFPVLAQNTNQLKAFKKSASKFGLAVRGVGGEHTGTGQNGFIDVSPGVRLGVTEGEIMQHLFSGTAALWALAKEFLPN